MPAKIKEPKEPKPPKELKKDKKKQFLTLANQGFFTWLIIAIASLRTVDYNCLFIRIHSRSKCTCGNWQCGLLIFAFSEACKRNASCIQKYKYKY
jgi:hypothetical protein